MGGETTNPFLPRVSPLEHLRTSRLVIFRPGGDGEESLLELALRHPNAVIPDGYKPTARVGERFSIDHDSCCVCVIRILDKLDECRRVAPNQELSQLSKR